MRNAIITGSGHYVPENVITNHDLERMMETSHQWIIERTGIVERRWMTENDTVAGMAYKASLMALEQANKKPEDIDCIIFATLMADHVFPGGGCILGEKLGIPGIPAFDIRNACSGFVYSITMANSFIKSGLYDNILVVGAEGVSHCLDKTTKGRNTAVIFADGAGAVVVSASDEPDKGIISTHIHADGRHAAPLSGISPYMPKTIPYDPEVPGDGVKIYMDGQYVFKHAVTKFPKVIVEALESAGLSVKDLDLLIPHQANLRITQAVGQRLGLPEEKVVSNIQKYGNTTAASIPIAMSEAWRDGRIKAGTNVCIASFGAGFTWGAAVIRF